MSGWGWKLAGMASVSAFYWLWSHVGLVPALIPPVTTTLAAYIAQRSSR
jgi:hypothetical protein